MRVERIMQRVVSTCFAEDGLDVAARLLWDHDVGALPVLRDGRVVAMVTDRDICMAALFEGKPLWALPVSVAMSKELFAASPEDDVADVLALMRERQVHRVPLLDAQGQPQGIVSMTDLARWACATVGPDDAVGPREVVSTLKAITEPRRTDEASGSTEPPG